MQNILLSSEGGPWPPKSTVTTILGKHQAAATTILGPAQSLPGVRDNHPGQLFPLLTHNIMCSFLCTPCSLLQGLRFFCKAREEVWRIQSLFFRHHSRLMPSGVTWVSWRVWHRCDSTFESSPSLFTVAFRSQQARMLFWPSEMFAQMEESTFVSQQSFSAGSLCIMCHCCPYQCVYLRDQHKTGTAQDWFGQGWAGLYGLGYFSSKGKSQWKYSPDKIHEWLHNVCRWSLAPLCPWSPGS